MAYDQSVRQLMNQAGYDNSKIGYDPNSGYVQYEGKPFMKPQVNNAGTTYTDIPTFQQAHQSFQNSNRSNPAIETATTQPVTASSTQTPNYNDIIGNIYSQIMHPAAFDVYNSPQYKAAQDQANYQAGLATRNAQESLGASGFGRSTNLSDRAQMIQQDANQRLMTQVVPQLIQQNNAQEQQRLANLSGLISPLMQAEQNRFNNGIATAGLTGYYTPDAQLVDNVKKIMAANSAAYAGASPEEQQRLHAENVRLAASIGGKDTTGNGDYVYSPIRTMQGQQADTNNMQIMAQLTGKLPDGTPTNAAQQQQLANEWKAAEAMGIITPGLAQLYGIPAGTPTMQAKQMAAEIAARNASIGIEAQNAATSSSRLQWEMDPNNPDNIYKNAMANYRDNSVPPGGKNALDSTYVSNIQQMSPEMRTKFFNDEKSNIIKDLGVAGYNQLYNMYFDKYGSPK